MPPRAALSKGEMEVARVLWEVGPAAVRQVHESLSKEREMDFATVQTYLRRLEVKGYASSKLQGRTRIYSAKTKPQTVIRDTVNDLVDRLFGGNTLPLMKHLIEERGINQSDIDQLRRLIDDLEVEGNSKAKNKREGESK
ncbi:MAG: BlaI/MecI/CopY family transcriptional regulator [Pirellulales bacterium]